MRFMQHDRQQTKANPDQVLKWRTLLPCILHPQAAISTTPMDTHTHFFRPLASGLVFSGHPFCGHCGMAIAGAKR